MSLINVTNLTFAYDGSYENIFENVSFQLDTNWRLGFTGRNGRGKTTFLKLLLGKYEYRGFISTSVAFSYFPYHVMDPNVTALETVEEMYPSFFLLLSQNRRFGYADSFLHRAEICGIL